MVINIFCSCIQEVCKHLQDDSLEGEALITNIVAGANVYFNYTGKSKCLNTGHTGTSDLGETGWNFQVKDTKQMKTI